MHDRMLSPNPPKFHNILCFIDAAKTFDCATDGELCKDLYQRGVLKFLARILVFEYAHRDVIPCQCRCNVVHQGAWSVILSLIGMFADDSVISFFVLTMCLGFQQILIVGKSNIMIVHSLEN